MEQPKAMANLRAVVSDLDDTLLTEDHRMTNRTAATLTRLVNAGVHVVLASGRMAASIRPFALRINTPDPIIASNGAQIVDPKTNRVLAAAELPLPLARDVLRWFEARGVYTQYYHGDDWFFAKRNDLSDSYAASTGVDGTEAGMPLSAHIGAPSPKVLAMADPADVPGLIKQARAHFGDALYVTTSKPYFVEITSPEATKGNAVQTLAGMLDLTPETTICAGDSLNDLSMLLWSKVPVTVENARDEVKAAARFIGGDGRHDGLADLLDILIP